MHLCHMLHCINMVFILLLHNQEAQGAIHESRALKSRVHLAEAAQKEARSMEVDYEEAMRLLEDEIKELNHKLKVAQQTKVCMLY